MVLLQETTKSNLRFQGPNTVHAYFIKSTASITASFENRIDINIIYDSEHRGIPYIG
jgi:hypothetical protein